MRETQTATNKAARLLGFERGIERVFLVEQRGYFIASLVPKNVPCFENLPVGIVVGRRVGLEVGRREGFDLFDMEY